MLNNCSWFLLQPNLILPLECFKKEENYYFSAICTSSVLAHKTSNVSQMFSTIIFPKLFILFYFSSKNPFLNQIKMAPWLFQLLRLNWRWHKSIWSDMAVEKMCSLLAPIYLSNDYTDKSSQSDKVCLVLFSFRASKLSSHEVKTK